ncbi:MAG: GTP-binding protein, partial [Actinomycetia bacterium]|nr:GTP-binding protein [Actinomycetes bacterium]
MDLTEAESIDSLIRARTQFELNISLNNLNGKLKDYIFGIKDLFLEIISNCEMLIDFTDDLADNKVSTYPELKIKLATIEKKLTKLLYTRKVAALAEEGIQIGVIGPANSGKSSLINRFMLEDKILVSDIPGTTRDTIKNILEIGGYRIIMIDTAGFLTPENSLDEAAIEKTWKIIDKTFFNLVVLDSSTPLTDEISSVLQKLAGYKNLFLLNKSDLPLRTDTDRIIEITGIDPLCISVKTGDNLEQLSGKIIDIIKEMGMVESDVPVLLKERYENLILSIASNIKKIDKLFSENEIPEIITIELKETLELLFEITGEIVNEDILDNIFSGFCIG